MRIAILGGTGTIGSLLREHFSKEHEVITAGRNSGDYKVDLENSTSIKKFFEKTGLLDAIICVAGEAVWNDFDKLTEADFNLGLQSKLMGQVNVVRLGRDYLNPGGSITLSTGILADDPVPKTSSAAMVNGAIHSFVKAVVLDIDEPIRINVVSLGMVEPAYDKYKDFFPGHNPVPTIRVLKAYERSLLGKDNGRVIREY